MVFLLSSLAAIGLAVASALVPQTGSGPASRPGSAPSSAPAASPERWRCRCRVLDAAGRPIAGAGVLLGLEHIVTTAEVLAQPGVRSDADGNLDAELLAPAGPAGERWAVVVAAPGKAAFCWSFVPRPSDGAANLALDTVVLADGVTLRGVVRDEAGRPLAGARVVASDLLADAVWRASMGDRRRLASCAVSGPDGLFELVGALAEAVRVTVTAEGHFERVLPLTDPTARIACVLTAAGHVQGRVLAPGTVPPQVEMMLQYAGDSERWQTVAVDSVGRFKAPILRSGGFRLAAWSEALRAVGESPILDRPTNDVTIQLRAPGPDFVVRAVDDETGAPVRSFRAYASRFEWPWWQVEPAPSAMTPCDASGTVRLPGRPANAVDGEHAVIRIEATGFGTQEVRHADEEGELTVRLVREAVIEGKVIDDVSGEPVAGAEIACYALNSRGHAFALGCRRYRPTWGAGPFSARDGSFTVRALEPGSWVLAARWRDCPELPLERLPRIEVAASERRQDVRIPVLRGAPITGRVTGARPGPGWRIAVEAPVVMLFHAPTEREPFETNADRSNVVPLAPDGSFRFPNLGIGEHQLYLRVAVGPRSGPDLRCPLGKVVIERGGKPLVLDGSRCAPATLRGKVVLVGAPVPRGRLVVAGRCVEDQERFGGRPLALDPDPLVSAPCGLVACDGSYELQLAPTARQDERDPPYGLKLVPATHKIFVVDAETGVVLWREPAPIRLDPGATVVKDLTVPVAPVTVRSAAAWGKWAAALRLEVHFEHVRLPPQYAIGPTWIELPSDALPLTFLVPAGPVELRVVPVQLMSVSVPVPASRPAPPEPLASLSVTAVAGSPIELQMPARGPDSSGPDSQAPASRPGRR